MSKTAHRFIRVAILLAILAFVVFLLTPSALVRSAVVPELPEDLDSYLAASERDVTTRYGLIPGTEKRIRWQVHNNRTEYAVVYLHGFSATRQAYAPTPELIADALGANLFETRLTGHGRVEQAMTGIVAEDWLEDAAEALAIGARIGDRIILIGTSTGATLALAMGGDASFERVDTLVLISPNFAPADSNAGLLTGPAGPVIARLLVGETRTWTPHNERHGRFWTTSYPITAAVEMMRLVDHVQSRLPLDLGSDVLVLISPDDRVVSPAATLAAVGKIGAPRKQLLEFEDVGDPSRHVLAGDILSPDTTEQVAAAIVEFVRAL